MTDRPRCPVCTSTQVRWNAVEADCGKCGHTWPVEQLRLPIALDDVGRFPEVSTPLRVIRDRAAGRRFDATGSAVPA